MSEKKTNIGKYKKIQVKYFTNPISRAIISIYNIKYYKALTVSAVYF